MATTPPGHDGQASRYRLRWMARRVQRRRRGTPWKANSTIPNAYCGIDWLFLPQRRCLIHTMTAPLNFKFVDHLRPPCFKCGRPLILTYFEPEEPGFGLRVLCGLRSE